MKFFDTIGAIATPLGNGGIAVIRISGEDAVSYAEKLIFPLGGKNFSDLESHKMTLSNVKTGSGNLIDEALCVIMRAPNPIPAKMLLKSIATAALCLHG